MLKSLLAFTGRAGDGSDYVFPTVSPKEDGPDCTRDCADCTVRYPSRFKVETSRQLYGHIKPFTTHLLVATGKDDWVEKVERERGSLMEALHDSSATDKYGRVMISASNIPVDGYASNAEKGSTVLVLPSFTFVDSVTSSDIPELVDRFVAPNSKPGAENAAEKPGKLVSRPCPHDYVVLLCSHRRRDARCGISAPLIKKELERHLRPLGLYRDMDDERPGGVGIYYVSHVGGHKFAANVLVYRKQDQQMIWLARIRPEHCEGIVKYTILKGKVVHPESQLRGGFDKTRGLTSW